MTQLKSKTGRPYTYDWTAIGAALLEEYCNGSSVEMVAAKHGIPRQTVGRYLVKQGVMRTRKAAMRVRTHRGRDSTAPKEGRACKHCTRQFAASSGGSQYCETCIPDRKFYSRFNSYGISKPEWDRLLEKQNGTCALCDAPPKHVDHDHITDVVRGLLCVHCNLSMARVEMPGWLQRADVYTKNDTGFRVNPKHKHRKLREKARLNQRDRNPL